MKTKLFIFGFLCLILLVSCAPSNPDGSSTVYGFWSGLWHGFIFFYVFVWKMIGYALYFINKNWGNWNVGLWADMNTGWPYWTGYIIGFVVSSTWAQIKGFFKFFLK